MNAGIDGGVDALHLTLLIDQVTDPIGKARAGIITCTIRQTYTPRRVTQECVRKAEFFRKSGVFLNRIKADSQNLDILRFEVFNLVAEPTTLNRSTRGIGFWIKP